MTAPDTQQLAGRTLEDAEGLEIAQAAVSAMFMPVPFACGDGVSMSWRRADGWRGGRIVCPDAADRAAYHIERLAKLAADELRVAAHAARHPTTRSAA